MSGYNYNYNEQTDTNNILNPNFTFTHMNSINNSTIGYITQNNFIPNTNNINNYYQIMTPTISQIPTITTTSPALTSTIPTISTSFANSLLFPGTTTQIFNTITGPLGHHIYGLTGPTGGNYTIIDSGASGHNGPNPIYNHEENIIEDTGGPNYPPIGPQYDNEIPYYNGPQGATGHFGCPIGLTGTWGGMDNYGNVLKIKNKNFEFEANSSYHNRYYYLKYNNKKTNVILKINPNTDEPYSNPKFMRLIKELDYISNYEKDIDIVSKCQTIIRRDKYIKQKMDRKMKITI